MSNIKQVYLDNNATTALTDNVSSVVTDLCVLDIFGNPNSAHQKGQISRALVETAREEVARALGCSSSEVVFTSGGTESNNMVIRKVAGEPLDNSKYIVISPVEHSSVLNTVQEVCPDLNYFTIPMNRDGTLNLEEADRLISEDTVLVSIMLANNITGSILNVKEVAQIAHSKGVLVHCDAVQAFGKMKLDVYDLDVDFLSISGHKAHAMPGIGALYIKDSIKIRPLISGGGQESGYRSGTENYIGIATLGVAAGEIKEDSFGYVEGLRDCFELGLRRKIKGIKFFGESHKRICNTSAVYFPGVNSLSMALLLEENGVFVSTGPACSAGVPEISPAILNMGYNLEEASSVVRFSFSKLNNVLDVSRAIEACEQSYKKLTGE